jgi:hypothetical protein
VYKAKREAFEAHMQFEFTEHLPVGQRDRHLCRHTRDAIRRPMWPFPLPRSRLPGRRRDGQIF